MEKKLDTIKEKNITSDAPVDGASFVKNSVTSDTSVVLKDNGMITMSRQDLQSLVQQEVQKAVFRGIEKPKRVTDHVARLRLYKDQPVVWYGNIREFRDKDTGKLVAWMDIKVYGSEEKIKVHYLDFLSGQNDYQDNGIEVKIKEQKPERIVTSKGRRVAINADPVNNKKFEPFEYEEEVVRYEYQAIIELPNGQVITVPSICLNP